jgi:hypothetical protein
MEYFLQSKTSHKQCKSISPLLRVGPEVYLTGKQSKGTLKYMALIEHSYLIGE